MLSPKRAAESRPRPQLLPGLLFCAALVAISASVPMDKCPRSLDCAREGRHFCHPGSSHCGPCLTPLEENAEGKCVVRRRHAHIPKVTTLPDLDEEIDFLSSIIAKQQTSEVKHSAPPSQDEPAEHTKSSPSHVPTDRPATERPATSALQTPSQPVVWGEPVVAPYPHSNRVLTVMTAAFIVLGTGALAVAAVCWIRLQRGTRLAQKVDYPAFRVMGPHSFDSSLTGDKKLVQSAQMFHYQHQKQQMLSLERQRGEHKVPDSGTTSDEENEDGDFTVYECPGLAPTGEMEVRNPLFDDSSLQLQRNHK